MVREVRSVHDCALEFKACVWKGEKVECEGQGGWSSGVDARSAEDGVFKRSADHRLWLDFA